MIETPFPRHDICGKFMLLFSLRDVCEVGITRLRVIIQFKHRVERFLKFYITVLVNATGINPEVLKMVALRLHPTEPNLIISSFVLGNVISHVPISDFCPNGAQVRYKILPATPFPCNIDPSKYSSMPEAVPFPNSMLKFLPTIRFLLCAHPISFSTHHDIHTACSPFFHFVSIFASKWIPFL
jgi:hypothetical protein